MLTSYTITPLSRQEGGSSSAKPSISVEGGGLNRRTLEAELLYFVVVVLAVEDLPLLRAFEDDLALGGDLEAGGCVEFSLGGEQFFEGFAGFLADGVAVFEEVALGDFGQGVGDGVGELIDFIARDSHRTALYLRASSFFTFLNISG